MHITFIMPAIGRKEGETYLKTWQMEPLPIAQVASLTPAGHKLSFFDDRIEDINYEAKTDVVAITIETYTAKRAYEISEKFRQKNVLVVMGGFHATLMSKEVSKHCDIVVVGEAEGIWPKVVQDIIDNKYKSTYTNNHRPLLKNIHPNRSLFKGKKYLPIALVESARGCKFNCSFCSVTSFYNHSYNSRPINEVVAEVKSLSKKTIFFIDDNFGADLNRAKELCLSLIPLKIKWVGQVSINIANDIELLTLMQASGCLGVLIGVESINSASLKKINKQWNQSLDYRQALKNFKNHGMVIYGSFIFGLDSDTTSTFNDTLKFAIQEKMYLAAFNHLVPFPGTPLYNQLNQEKRLLYPKWWLQDSVRFGDVYHLPKNMTPSELSESAYQAKKKFYNFKSIFIRSLTLKNNCRNFALAFNYFILNLLFRKEVNIRKGLILGKK